MNQWLKAQEVTSELDMLVRKALLDFLVPRRIFCGGGGGAGCAVALDCGFGCSLRLQLNLATRERGGLRGRWLRFQGLVSGFKVWL